MASIVEAARKAAEVVKSRTDITPRVGIILGTGLSALARKIKSDTAIPYEDVPGFARTTVATHSGQLLPGTIHGVPVVAMEGRFHMYEGYSAKEVTFPVRLLKALGAEILIVSNAGGGLNTAYDYGDIVAIEDQINLMGANPLVGPHEEELGIRFPDMYEPYDRKLLELAKEIAAENGIRLHEGVYAAMLGPCLETRAEYRMLATLGVDVIGMSTVPEVIVATQAGMRVLGLSVVTDLCYPGKLKPVSIDEIIKTATEAEPKLAKLVEEVIARMK